MNCKVSRCINECHFLPQKPGVIAYAAGELIWIVVEMSIVIKFFMISYFNFLLIFHLQNNSMR